MLSPSGPISVFSITQKRHFPDYQIVFDLLPLREGHRKHNGLKSVTTLSYGKLLVTTRKYQEKIFLAPTYTFCLHHYIIRICMYEYCSKCVLMQSVYYVDIQCLRIR